MAVQWRGAPKVEEAAERGVRMALDALREEAVARSPTDTGAMDDSAVVEVEGRHGELAFTARYAEIQEQRKTYEHDDGQAGFLAASLADLPYETILAEQIRRVLG